MKVNFITIKIAYVINKYSKTLLGIVCFLIALISTQGGDVEILQKIDFYITIFLFLLIFVYVLFSVLKIHIFSSLEEKDKAKIDLETELMLDRTYRQIKYFFITFVFVLSKFYFSYNDYYEEFIVIIEDTWLIYALTYSLVINTHQAYSYLYDKVASLKTIIK